VFWKRLKPSHVFPSGMIHALRMLLLVGFWIKRGWRRSAQAATDGGLFTGDQNDRQLLALAVRMHREPGNAHWGLQLGNLPSRDGRVEESLGDGGDCQIPCCQRLVY
jgi:hypothetical protein